MKIALLGYGKMGQMIAQIAENRNHEVVLVISEDNLEDLTVSNLKKADVAIDFSTPDAALDNIQLCFEANVPLVMGTTGWYGKLQTVKNDCMSGNNTFLYASNFSVGVNLFFEINKQVAKLMQRYGSTYEVQVEEIHHTQKLDSPSGTAMTIAEDLIHEISTKDEWVNELVNDGGIDEIELKDNQLLIESHRIENVPGTHSVIYSSEVDNIEIVHRAHNRKGFALGAVIAAEWLQDKVGFFNMSDVFDFKSV